MEQVLWNHGREPRSRDVGLFSDLMLFGETLRLCAERGSVTESLLMRELDQRSRGLFLMKTPSPKVISQLVRELREFEWITPVDSGRSPSVAYCLTPDGDAALSTYRVDRPEFRVMLAKLMHQVYLIPGWFVDRLWKINPAGQGEVIIPAPMSDWRPESTSLGTARWTSELKSQTVRSAECACQASKGAFPISQSDWIDSVQVAWNRLAKLQPKNRTAEHYQPRDRLHLAMREATVKILFAQTPYGAAAPDFPGSKSPTPPRSFRAWCLRLAALEFISYTDTHPMVRGRLIFPAAVFRRAASKVYFKNIPAIESPSGETLWLHQPEWESFRAEFWSTVIQVHREVSLRAKSLYVSLLDVRDEVCRQLRLSADTFDRFITKGLQEFPRDGLGYTVSVETDIREDQLSGHGRLRRPVYIGMVPHSLIAIARLGKLAGEKTE